MRLMPVAWCGTMVCCFLAGYAVGPGSAAGQAPAGAAQGAATQAPPQGGALPPGDYSRIRLAPDQGEPTHYSSQQLRAAHAELQARSAKTRQVIANPRELMPPLVTRTHSYIMVHRPGSATPVETVNGEEHEGVTDVYFVVGGSGTVVVGGDIRNRRMPRPGEVLGPITGGRSFTLQAGDLLNIPPNIPHGTMADEGGMTYVLMKLNVGLYPWSLINCTP
jgi:mannose-6-phosphate isomerase-like protein (cupin superfamily)